MGLVERDKLIDGVKPSYSVMLNRASLVTFRVPYDKLSTSAEKHYIKVGVDRMLAKDYSNGGYGGKYLQYIIKGGRLPKPIK